MEFFMAISKPRPGQVLEARVADPTYGAPTAGRSLT
jgi:hypothetical protein